MIYFLKVLVNISYLWYQKQLFHFLFLSCELNSLFSVVLDLQTSTTFSYTGAMQSFTVPVGVTSVVISASGAQGGGGHGGCNTPGFGGVVNATFFVTAGQIL